MRPPRYARKGEDARTLWILFNELKDFCISFTPLPSGDILGERTSTGTSYRLAKDRRGGAKSGTDYFPRFHIVAKSGLTVTMKFGDRVFPLRGVGGQPLKLTLAEGDMTLPDNSTQQIYIAVNPDPFVPTSLTRHSATVTPDQPAPLALRYLHKATVVTSSGIVTSILNYDMDQVDWSFSFYE